MWDPFRDLDRWKKLAGMNGDGFFSSTCRGSWIPPVDFYDKKNEYKMVVDMPGLAKEDIKVDLEENRLCISGNRKALADHSEQQYLVVSERGNGWFERCFEMPHRVQENSVTASFKDSILTVTLTKDQGSDTKNSTSVRVD